MTFWYNLIIGIMYNSFYYTRKLNETRSLLSVVIISLLGLYSGPCYPIIESIFIDKKDGRIIVCLGECHTPFYNQSDPQAASEDRDKQLLLALIQKISRGTIPTTVVMETKPQDMTKARSINPDQGEFKSGCLDTIGAYAAQHDNQIGSVEFIWADNRGPVSQEINEVFSFFSNPMFYQLFCQRFLQQFGRLSATCNFRPAVGQAIGQLLINVRQIILIVLLAACPELREPFFSKEGIFDLLRARCSDRLHGYTAQELIAEIDANIATIVRFQETYTTTRT